MSAPHAPLVAGSLWSVPADEQLSAVERLRARGLRRLHWDVTDGRFAQAGGFSPDRAAEITELTGVAAEAHIMAERAPDVDVWCDFCDTVVVHIESDGWEAAVDRIVRRGRIPALALSPETPESGLPSDIAVLCMTVVPGRAGSTFDARVLDKVARIRHETPQRLIGVDGGVTRAHAERASENGARWFVVGTDLFADGGDDRWEQVLSG